MDRRQWAKMLLLASLTSLWIGCGDVENAAGGIPPEGPAGVGDRPIEIEESDLYRRLGDKLYVQNAASGLSVIDIADPARPRLLSQTPVVGKAGELYVRDGYALVLLEDATPACTRPDGFAGSSVWQAEAEIILVDLTNPLAPDVAGRYCMVGNPVASRLVEDFLILVTTGPGVAAEASSMVLSLDVHDPGRACVVDQINLAQPAAEIHLDQQALYVAGQLPDRTVVDLPRRGSAQAFPGEWQPQTRLQRIDIDLGDGSLHRRGAFKVAGTPQGRFHMNAEGPHFRIITYDPYQLESLLHVIDVSDPDAPHTISSLTGIGRGEQLFAARFDGSLAYVVTFRQTDPLWIIDLSNPHRPQIVGELQVPGWSDYILPRGDRLLAVGRGDGGQGVGVSLFDVSNPTAPRALRQLTIGASGETTSEANVDHRAITVIEPEGGKRDLPLLLVPYSSASYGFGGCRATSHVQLIDVHRSDLARQGTITQDGQVLRTFIANDTLLSISRAEVVAVDIGDRRAPLIQGSVPLDASEQASCWPTMTDTSLWVDDDIARDNEGPDCGFFLGCTIGTGPTSAWPAFVLLLASLYRIRRRRGRRTGSLVRLQVSMWLAAVTAALAGCGDVSNSDYSQGPPPIANVPYAGPTGPSPLAEQIELDDAQNQRQVSPFVMTAFDPRSTFAVDVDSASYDVLRQYVGEGSKPPAETVRLEEYVNAFDYDYAPPEGEHPFAVHLSLSASPLYPESMMLRIGVAALEPERFAKKPANLVFLIDVSGSMSASNKLGLAKTMLTLALDRLDSDDTIAIVTYAASTAVLLEPTPVSQRALITTAISNLESGGSTAGAAGIQLAYAQAESAYLADGINHVVICTDGDFNVGPASTDELVQLIEQKRKSGITLTVAGFGLGLNDPMMEAVSNKGNGTYSVIYDEERAADYVQNDLSSTIQHVAKDVKIQLELNPKWVKAYRQLGYDNRQLADDEFRNDRIDAGEIGAGHQVTALYQLVGDGEQIPSPADAPQVADGDPTSEVPEMPADVLAQVRFRYKAPDASEADAASEFVVSVQAPQVPLESGSLDDRWATGVAAMAEWLAQNPFFSTDFLPLLSTELAATAGQATDRTELLQLFAKL